MPNLRFTVNGREVNNPAMRALAMIIFLALFALMMLVLLPVIGLVLAVGAGVIALAVGGAVAARLFGPVTLQAWTGAKGAGGDSGSDGD